MAVTTHIVIEPMIRRGLRNSAKQVDLLASTCITSTSEVLSSAKGSEVTIQVRDDTFFVPPVLRIFSTPVPTALVIPTSLEFGTSYIHGHLAIFSHENKELETNVVATPTGHLEP